MKESDIVDLLDTIRTSIYVTPVISEYLLNALIKLTTRFQQPTQINRVRTILTQYQDEMRRTGISYQEMFKKVKGQIARDKKLILR